VSDRVAFRLLLLGVVVTWFVTGFPDPGKVDDSHAVPLSGKTSLRWRGSRRRLATCRHDLCRGFLQWSRNSWAWLKKDSWGSSLPWQRLASIPGECCC
jgi:hypothetical protein